MLNDSRNNGIVEIKLIGLTTKQIHIERVLEK